MTIAVMKSKAEVGQVFDGGTVRVVLPVSPIAKSRAINVVADCSLCGKIYEVRYAILANGRQRSCGCYGKSLFCEHWELKVSYLTRQRRKELVEEDYRNFCEGNGLPPGKERYVLDFLRRDEWKKIAEMPDQEIQRISFLARNCPIAEVAESEGLPEFTVLRISWQGNRQEEGRQALLQEETGDITEQLEIAINEKIADPEVANSLFLLHATSAPHREMWRDTLQEGLTTALDRLNEEGRWDCDEFTSKELGSSKVEGAFDWIDGVLRSLRLLDIGYPTALFGEEAEIFLSRCALTRHRRKRRQQATVRDIEKGLPLRQRRDPGEDVPWLRKASPPEGTRAVALSMNLVELSQRTRVTSQQRSAQSRDGNSQMAA